MIVTWRGKQGNQTYDRGVVFTRRAVPISQTVTPGTAGLVLSGSAGPRIGQGYVPATLALVALGRAPQLRLVVTVPAAANLTLGAFALQLRLRVTAQALALLIIAFVPEARTPAIYPNASWTPVIYLRARP